MRARSCSGSTVLFIRAIAGHTWGGSGAAAQTTADTLATSAWRGVLAVSKLVRTLGVVLSAADDVENELDGLLTYDRQVTKSWPRRLQLPTRT